MKKLPIFVIVLIFIVNFCAGFTLVFKLITPYIAEKNTWSVENDPPPDYEVLAFTKNDVQIVKLKELADFRRQHSDFSFLMPKGQENYFAEKLTEKSEEMIFKLEAEQISDERQLIHISSDNIRSIVTHKYEATDKEVFPKTSMYLNMRYTPFKFAVSSIGGAIMCLIFFFIYKKYLKV